MDVFLCHYILLLDLLLVKEPISPCIVSCLLLNLFPGESGYIYAICFAVRSVLGLKSRSFFFSHLFSFLSLFLSKRVDIFVPLILL